MTKLLVVEDSEFFSSVIKQFVQRDLGIEVVTAANMALAETAIAENDGEFFLALLDLNLPDAPSGEVVDAVLAHRIPSVVFTATFNDEVREEILPKGVVDYILKDNTSSIEYVVALVRRLFRNRDIKVLAVDDSAVERKMLTYLLEQSQFQVFTAENGKQGLQVLKEHPDIKLIVTDYYMPEMDGFDLIRNVRKTYSRAGLSIIGISAKGTQAISAKFIKFGANDFINKPFLKEEFFWRVNQNVEMIEQFERLERAANWDYLTGLPNRRQFFAKGARLFEAASKEESKLSVAILDVDRFKLINDTYGHDVGDAVLKQIGEFLGAQVSDNDIAARLGGEEFCLLVSDMSETQLKLYMERVRTGIETATFGTDEQKVSVTISIGVCVEISETLGEMMAIADTMLYQAKEQGRNRVLLQ